MYRACSRCGRIHPQGAACGQTLKRSRREDEATRARASNAWKRKSFEVREKALFCCEVCRDQENYYNYKNIEVHHIIKLVDDVEGLLDDLNLVALCPAHHKLADKNLISVEYLKGLARAREGEQ